jgi:hypothetical protein
MSEFYDQEPEDPEHTGYRIEFEGDELIFAWFTTRIRLFKDEQYNHVEVTDENDNLKSIRVAPSFMKFLLDHDFPRSWDPVPDEETTEWFIKVEMKDVEAGLQ